MFARRSVTGKKPVAWSGKRELVSKGIASDRGERNFRHTVLRLRIRNPDGGVGDVHLILPHGQKFLVDPQARLREDANDVAQELRTLSLNPLLFRPGNIVRFEQAFDDNRKFDAGTWIRRK